MTHRVTKEYCIDERGAARWNVTRWKGETLCCSYGFPPHSEAKADERMAMEINTLRLRK